MSINGKVALVTRAGRPARLLREALEELERIVSTSSRKTTLKAAIRFGDYLVDRAESKPETILVQIVLHLLSGAAKRAGDRGYGFLALRPSRTAAMWRAGPRRSLLRGSQSVRGGTFTRSHRSINCGFHPLAQ